MILKKTESVQPLVKQRLFSNAALKKLIAPLLVEQLLSVMVGMADIMMVSAAGETAVSGVALVDLINVLIINIFAALGTGGAVVVAQLLGAKQPQRAQTAANQLIYITGLIGVLLMAVVCLWRVPLLHLLFGRYRKGRHGQCSDLFSYFFFFLPVHRRIQCRCSAVPRTGQFQNFHVYVGADERR